MADSLPAAWWCPDLSLPTQFEMARDRQALTRMHRDELAERADDLVVEWYRLREAVQGASREIAALQCQLALAQAPCTEGQNPPRDEHHQWVRELQGQR
jgi:hypothetical protein